jgi:hypothetical protein
MITCRCSSSRSSRCPRARSMERSSRAPIRLGRPVISPAVAGDQVRLVHGSTTEDLARTARCPRHVLTRAPRDVGRGGISERASRPVPPSRCTI